MTEITVFDILVIVLLGIIEGITEWLPISSTGHMLIFDKLLTFSADAEFKNVFFVVIQLGAILAVAVTFFKEMMPFGLRSSTSVSGEMPVFASEGEKRLCIKKETVCLWLKIGVACLPSAVFGFFLDGIIEERLGTPCVISAMLVLYGAAFVLVEKINKERTPKVDSLENIGFLQALFIGLFQVLSLVPGTSRSGATVIGALIIGIDRVAATKFSFFLAVPTMLGASTLKLIKYGIEFSLAELAALSVGMAMAFAVSCASVRFLTDFVKKHDFSVFGLYRILLGGAVLLLLPI